MTDTSKISELALARRAIRSARERTEERIGSGNLDRFGNEKPLVAPTPTAGAYTSLHASERGADREKSTEQVEREVVGDSIVIKGKIKAMKLAERNVGQHKQALKLSPTLTVPTARNRRATNKNGATSFHFKYEAISKARPDQLSVNGKSKNNAGRDHSKYLERSAVVARHHETLDSSRADGKDREISPSSHASSGGRYIEREEALAHHENGVPVIYSNISQDADERHRFWELVEKHATIPNPDILSITTGQALDFWEAVRNDPHCPANLSLAIAEAEPSKRFQVVTTDNEPIRKIMSAHGWVPPSPTEPGETRAQKQARLKLDADNAKGGICIDGRGGRIQTRIIGELPHEVTPEQRIRIVREFAAEFKEKNLPYVAVMHAPDHANNEKNWHFHLAYYERPCSVFTGVESDYIKPPKEDANWHNDAQREAKIEALRSGKLNQFIGRLDFTVPMIRKDKGRHTVITYPFAQRTDRGCSGLGYPLKLRKRLAQLINDELKIAGAARRVDPRRFAEMGISKQPEEHLGSRSAQMETLGIATPRGVENEHRQWTHSLSIIEEKSKADTRNTANEARRWRQRLESQELNPHYHSEVSKMITQWAVTKLEADELTAVANELKEHIERAQSRPLKVEETCQRHLDAIQDGRASKRQRSNKTNYEARLVEARDHLSGLTVIMASEIVYEKRVRGQAKQQTQEAEKLLAALDKRMKVEMAAMKSLTPLAQRYDNIRAVTARGLAMPHINDDLDDDFSARTVTGNLNVSLGPSSDAKSGGTQNFPTGNIGSLPPIVKKPATDLPIRLTARPTAGSRQHVKSVESGVVQMQSANQVVGQTHQPAETPRPSTPTTDHVDKVRMETLAQAEVMRKIDVIANNALCVIPKTHSDKSFFGISEPDMKAIGLIEDDLKAALIQKRLSAIKQRQENDIKRLVGFVRGSPGRTTISPDTPLYSNKPIIGLAQNAPRNLLDLSKKYAKHKDAQAQMCVALKAALPGLEKTNASGALVQRQAPSKPKQPTNESAIELKNVDQAALSPKVNSADGGEVVRVKKQTISLGDEPRFEDEKPFAVLPEGEASMPLPDETVLSQHAKQKPVASTAKQQEAEWSLPAVQPLSAEERHELLLPRKFGDMGGTEIVRNAANGDPNIDRAAKPTTSPKNVHPKIDAWIKAADEQDRGARQEAALELKNDRKALKIALVELDGKTQSRIRKDWEAELARHKARTIAEQQRVDEQPKQR